MPESYWSSDVLGRQRGTWPRTWQGSLPSSHLLFCSCIALSHFLCLFIVVRKKRIFSIFSLSSTSAKPSVYVPAHTHTHGQRTFPVRSKFSLQRPWPPIESSLIGCPFLVMTFLSWCLGTVGCACVSTGLEIFWLVWSFSRSFFKVRDQGLNQRKTRGKKMRCKTLNSFLINTWSSLHSGSYFLVECSSLIFCSLNPI